MFEWIGRIIAITIFCLVVGGIGCTVYGWAVNIVYLYKADFEPNYKCEVLRGVGIPFAPLGAVLGWVTFDEERNR